MCGRFHEDVRQRSQAQSRPLVQSSLLRCLCIQSFSITHPGERREGMGEQLAVTAVPRTSSWPIRQLKLCLCAVSIKQQLQKPTTERVLLADLHVELWSLFVTSGKLADLSVHVYNMHPDFERGNCGENCAYYNGIFTVCDCTWSVTFLQSDIKCVSLYEIFMFSCLHYIIITSQLRPDCHTQSSKWASIFRWAAGRAPGL